MSALPPDVNLQEDRGPQVNLWISIVAVLSTISILLRLVSRNLKGVSLGASDYSMIVGWLTAWGITGINYAGVTLGLGQHVQIVPIVNVIELLKITLASEILYCITLVASKISILLLYRSIFPGHNFALATNVVGAFVISWGIACILVSIFSCNPVRGFWDITVPSTCISTRNFFIGNSVPNIVMDVVILMLPMGKVWHLQMALKQKLAVSGMFLLGGFVCISSGIRLYFLLDMNQQDITWSYYGAAVWSVVEVNIAIVSANLPTMRPLLQHTMPKLRSLSFSYGLASKKVSQDGGSSQFSDTFALNQKGRDISERHKESV